MLPSHDRHPLLSLLARRRLRVLGINSGTSIDGLDMALVEIRHPGTRPIVRCLWTRHVAYPPRFRDALARLASEESVSKAVVSRAHFALGEFIAERVKKLLTPSNRMNVRGNTLTPTLSLTGREGRLVPSPLWGEGRVRGSEHGTASSHLLSRTLVLTDAHSSGAGLRVDLIGSHGQTIGHFPAPRGRRRGMLSATWQIGALSMIAQETGIVTIGDFRSADIAAGGMGAPLSGYYHHILFGPDVPVLNLGGIANISVSRQRRGQLEILAFDVGPGNMLLDALAGALLHRPYDRAGHVAAAGRPRTQIVTRALKEPYFRRQPPKSCGREEFGWAAVERLFFRQGRPRAPAADLLASAVDITARAVAQAMERWVAPFTRSRTLVVTGGGSRNLALMRRLEFILPHWQLRPAEDRSIPSCFVEPIGFAVLAHETLRARAGNLGGATGAAKPAVLGVIALP